jgi:hypothetical protein
MRHIFGALVLLSTFSLSATVGLAKTHYFEENKAPLLAPERGFYKYYHRNKYGYPAFIDLSKDRDFSWVRESGFTLISCRISLERYRYNDIPDEFLEQIQSGLDAVRDAGIKVILRFNYNNGNERGADSTLPWMLQHIARLKGLLYKNADVIAVVQAGFLGAWGEWHSSTHGLDNYTDRRKVLEALLNSLPNTRSVQVRAPQYKEALYGQPLTAQTAYKDTYAARIGHHNDCLFASENDLTYPLGKINYYREYVAQDALFVPVGGETCKRYPPRTNCNTARHEMEKLHYSYLNNNYLQAVIDGWRSEGCYDEIDLRLGYRLVVRQALFDETVHAGSGLTIGTQIENIGWAPPFNPRGLILTLEDPSGASMKVPLMQDTRMLRPGVITEISGYIPVPQEMKGGKYTLYLSAPDPASTLQDRYEYAMPFANVGYQLQEARLPLGHVTVLSR